MNEWSLVWQVPLKIIPTAIFAFFYVLGGRSNKWLRRWLGSSTFIVLVLLISLFSGFNWKMIPALSILYAGLVLGYGGDKFKTKLLRRFLYGLVLGLSGLAVGWVTGHLMLGIFQLILAIQASLFLGLINPDDAVDEEALIAIQSVVIIPFMVS